MCAMEFVWWACVVLRKGGAGDDDKAVFYIDVAQRKSLEMPRAIGVHVATFKIDDVGETSSKVPQ